MNIFHEFFGDPLKRAQRAKGGSVKHTNQRTHMNFIRNLFGGSSVSSTSSDGSIHENLLDEIVVVVSMPEGMPFPKVEESHARALYAKLNPKWSGKHRVTILQTVYDYGKCVKADEDFKSVKLCLAHRAIPKGGTLLVQMCEDDSPFLICLFTFLRWKHPDATKDQIAILTAPIPFTR
jgi:hypothetical protein